MIVEIEVLPRPTGVEGDRYRHVEAAIAAIGKTGVTYEVGALGTTFEAPADQAWNVARGAHDACLASGAESVITVIKLAQAANDTGPSMADLVAPFRR